MEYTYFFGNIDSKLREIENEMKKLEDMGELRELSEAKLARNKVLQSAIKSWKTRKGQLMRQYVRNKSLTEKDANTKYFHATATLKNKRKKICKIKIGDRVLRGKEEVKAGIRSFFEESFKQEDLPNIMLPNDAFNKILISMAAHM